MTYEKTYDLLDLAIWMQSNREGVSLNEIAEKFMVSRRTAERMRDMILYRFPQAQEVVGENNVKRWYIPQGTLKDFIQFDANELAILEKSKSLLKKGNMQEEANCLEQIINKVKASIKPNVLTRIEPDAEILSQSEMFVCRPSPKLNIDQNIVKTIQQALLEYHRIKIEYLFENPTRVQSMTLDAYGFLYGERNQYLIAHHSNDCAGNEVHMFMLTNIKMVEILSEPITVVPDFNLQKYAQQSFGIFHEKPFEVEWLFDKEVANQAENYIFHPTQKLKRNDDGSLTVKFKAGGKMEMDWFLYTWGNHVKVIKPKDWYKKKP